MNKKINGLLYSYKTKHGTAVQSYLKSSSDESQNNYVKCKRLHFKGYILYKST